MCASEQVVAHEGVRALCPGLNYSIWAALRGHISNQGPSMPPHCERSGCQLAGLGQRCLEMIPQMPSSQLSPLVAGTGYAPPPLANTPLARPGFSLGAGISRVEVECGGERDVGGGSCSNDRFVFKAPH